MKICKHWLKSDWPKASSRSQDVWQRKSLAQEGLQWQQTGKGANNGKGIGPKRVNMKDIGRATTRSKHWKGFGLGADTVGSFSRHLLLTCQHLLQTQLCLTKFYRLNFAWQNWACKRCWKVHTATLGLHKVLHICSKSVAEAAHVGEYQRC